MDTVKDRLKSKKLCSGKETKVGKAERSMGGSAAGSSRKITLSTLVKCKDAVKSSFLIMSRKLCILADIPLKKTEKR